MQCFIEDLSSLEHAGCACACSRKGEEIAAQDLPTGRVLFTETCMVSCASGPCEAPSKSLLKVLLRLEGLIRLSCGLSEMCRCGGRPDIDGRVGLPF